MTLPDLAKIEARAKAASKAPWLDYEFFVEACTDIPAIIAEMRRLQIAHTLAGAGEIEQRLLSPSGIGEPLDHIVMRDSADLIAAQRERIAEMEAALKPFTDINLIRDSDPSGIDAIDAPDLAITPADIRRARAALGREG